MKYSREIKIFITVVIIFALSDIFGLALASLVDDLGSRIVELLEYNEEIERNSWKNGEIILEGESNYLTSGYSYYCIYWEEKSSRKELYCDTDEP